jgi:hypothetical protein
MSNPPGGFEGIMVYCISKVKANYSLQERRACPVESVREAVTFKLLRTFQIP